MSEATLQTLTLDADGLTDLQIIAQAAPGKGDAFQRLLDRAQCSQAEIARRIGCTRASVTQWCSEARWPKPDTLRLALIQLGVDRKQLIDTWGILLGTEITPRGEAQELVVNLRNELLFITEPLERLLTIGRTLREQVFIRQGFKGFEDTRAAEYFTKELDKYEELERIKGSKEPRNVSPQVAKWAAGEDIYKQPATTTCSDEPVTAVDTTSTTESNQ